MVFFRCLPSEQDGNEELLSINEVLLHCKININKALITAPILSDPILKFKIGFDRVNEFNLLPHSPGPFSLTSSFFKSCSRGGECINKSHQPREPSTLCILRYCGRRTKTSRKGGKDVLSNLAGLLLMYSEI